MSERDPEHTRVLMLGWEYPPNFAGGLGIATQGIVEAMEAHASVDLLLPRFVRQEASPSAPCASGYASYSPSEPAQNYSSDVLKAAEQLRNKKPPQQSAYGENLMLLVEQFAFEAVDYAASKQTESGEYAFDIIHAHDWMTFPAALKLQELTGKPMVLHIHSLETDRTVDPLVDNPVVRLERHAIAQADRLLAVSDYTKQELIKHYKASDDHISVVHNGTPNIPDEGAAEEVTSSQTEAPPKEEWPWALPPEAENQEPKALPSWMGTYVKPEKPKQQILFLGRVTRQKGPLTFLRTAKRLLEEREDLTFTIAGLGDQLEEVMDMAVQEQIDSHVDFKGFVNRKAVKELLESTAVLFMPSASEPFGLVALEAAMMGLPIVASKQAGVMEVLPGVLTAESWDSKQFARHLNMILEYPELREGLGKANKTAAEKLTWSKAAEEIQQHYQQLLR